MAPNFFARLSKSLQMDSSPADSSPASRPTFGAGALIHERYRLDAEIGRGGMGIVYRARDLVQERDVAVKVINLSEANALTRQQFSREAEVAARLSHPHIVNVFEAGTVDAGGREPWPFIVMELVRGGGLDELRGLTYARILDIGGQICEALEYAHGQGFIHRDLKPANVLVEKRGFRLFTKLMDFGLARPRDASNLPSESNLAGTIYYLAPEVIAGQPASVASDLYALGAMLYEMVTGRVPFSDFIDDRAILLQHLTEPVTPPSQSRSDVPPALEAIILRLLAKDPNERFASAGEVRLALEQVADQKLEVSHGNLSHLPTASSERDDEIALVRSLLETNRLVTLLEDDGTLAIATGARLANQFADGVWLVELGSLENPALTLQTVASVLGVQADPNRALAVMLVESLREKNLLLLLNHCDRLLFACAQLAETILGACPEVYLLVTSHQPLNISGEKPHSTKNST